MHIERIRLARRCFIIAREFGRYLVLDDLLFFHLRDDLSDDDRFFVTSSLRFNSWVRLIGENHWEIVSD